MTEDEVVAALCRARKNNSQGVRLKARDTPVVREAVDRLAGAAIPVFTLVTDLPGTARAAYIGLDNGNAGRTAAYLVAQGLKRAGSVALTVRSQDGFAGETERFQAFCAELTKLRPVGRIVDVAGGADLRADTARRVSEELGRTGTVSAVYSIGGGNRAILAAMAEHGIGDVTFIAHDLDRENRQFLQEGAITFVLHHDLIADMRALFGGVLKHHGLSAWSAPSFSSDVQIAGPHNVPSLHG
ncbi:substrate-binding domain-containing protein [Cognatishimia sp. F0-27]|uniref:substrate-binding domain-containing protein n=1 Tax=Cognatishimia sp. F0-27 TaxID=2816855 RepID=UPI001D0C9378|nr:substrate-binding domain-containing protein [Cognatishimia sp. F0-27]